MTDTLNHRATPQRGDDPLAELARIVNRDKPREDPFSNIFHDARREATQTRGEPRFAPAASPPVRAPMQSDPEDEFDLAAPYASPPQTQDDDFYDDAGYDTQGARAEWDDAGDVEDDGYVGAEDSEPRQSRRGMALIAALIGLAVVGGGVGYAWKSGMFSTSQRSGAGGNAPVIAASKVPTKVDAQPAAVQPGAPAAGAGEQVVPREEQPVALGAPEPGSAATPRVVLPAPNATTPTRDIADAGASAEAGAADGQDGGDVADPVAEPKPATDTAKQEPRRVRTVKVLADGTIVTGEAPAAARTVPSLSGQAADASVATPPAEVTGADGIAVDPAQPAVSSRAIAGDAGPKIEDKIAAFPAADPADSADALAGADVTGDATDVAMPPPRPAKRTQVAAADPAAVEPVAPTKPAKAAPAPVAADPAGEPAAVAAAPAGGGFVVQIASAKSQADAQATMRNLQRKFADVIGNRPAAIKQVEIAGKGTFFRVRVGPLPSRDGAIQLCSALKSAGGDCVVARN